ncbi:hypothetical protein EOS93_25095 [Rhizobium sp. RMa-01]|nr:hypothetical protein BBJ66_22740 [Rhizobium sp. RSm-3]RVU08332.1 hypothetical protein EOS93_25095 [Rhizobium sp. RMa-01]
MSQIMTPWQKVIAKFGLPPARLAAELQRHRSKISRAAKDDSGLINGRDQALLLQAAKRLGVPLEPADLLPEG